jgi:hypothetical protein
MEQWWNNSDRGKPKGSENTCPSAILFSETVKIDQGKKKLIWL